MLEAAKEEIFSVPMVWTGEGVLPLAADPASLEDHSANEHTPAETRFTTTTQLSENSRLGSARKNPAPHQGSTWSNSASALGIREALLETRVRSRYTGKERDTETNLDDFGARYYSSQFGRWTSPDWSGAPSTVPYAELVNPQSLNLYAFARNNPVTSADLDGHMIAQDTMDRGAGDLGMGIGHWSPTTGPNLGEDNAAPEFAEVNTEKKTDTSSQPTTIPPDWAAAPVTPTSTPAPTPAPAPQQPGQTPTQPQPTPAASGANPYFSFSNVFNLKTASDFSAGAGDVLSFGTTYLARKYIFDSDKVVNKGSGAYITGAVTGAVISTAIAATGGAVANGKNGALFGRGGGFFNRGPVRFGWSWKGTAQAGKDVIRLGIGAARGTSWWSHIPFYYP
jgi:RHS repeat-associated protein